MKRLHAALISILLGAATIAGVFALANTVKLGPSKPDPSRAIALRQAQLNQVAAQIRALRKASPPKLAAVPRKQTAPAAEQVIYVRASAPATTSVSRHDDEGDGSLSATEGGGGFDD